MSLKSIFMCSVMALGLNAMADFPNCAADHCSKIDEEMNRFCIASGLAGKKYLVFGPTGSKCYCPCSCVAANTRVSFSDGAYSKQISRLTLKDPVFTPHTESRNSEVNWMLRSYLNRDQVWQIRLEGNRRIVVSGNHTFVNADKKIVKAESLKQQDKILDGNGRVVKVLGVKKLQNYHGYLYNLILNNSSPLASDHIYVTNGVQSGDWSLQTTTDSIQEEIDLRSEVVHTYQLPGKQR